MFKQRQNSPLQVIAVQSEKRSFKDKEKSVTSYYNRADTVKEDSKEYSHYVTIVLVVKNGEMYTKEFNGKWDLQDVKKWEELNG